MILQIAIGVALGTMLVGLLKWLAVQFLEWGSRSNFRGAVDRVLGWVVLVGGLGLVYVIARAVSGH